MGIFSYKFATTNTVLNLTDNGAISIKTPSSPNTPGTGTYNITITETASGKSYNTNVAVNVKTLCKSISLNANGTINTLHNLSNVTNYKAYDISYNVQYNSGNNYTVTNQYCAATYTVTSNPSSSGIKLANGKLTIPQLYEGEITITATNSQNVDSTKSVEKKITTKVFKPKVTLTIPATTYGKDVTLTYSVENNAPVGTVKFIKEDAYYTINGQTLTPRKAGDTKIKTYYDLSENFLAYTSEYIEFTIDKRTGSYTFDNIESTYGNGNFNSGLTYRDWFGSIIYSTGAINSSITVDENTGYVRVTGAGETTVTAIGTGDDNHYDFKASANITINKRSATSYSLAAAYFTYGDYTTYTMKLAYKDWYGNLEYSVPENSSSYITIGKTSGKATITGAGKTTVTVIGKGDNNHNNFRGDADIEIAKRTGSYTFVAAKCTYGVGSYNMKLTYSNWFGTIAYTVTAGSDYIGINDANKNKVTVKGAGTATVTATGSGDNNHNNFKTTANITIAKRTGTFSYKATADILSKLSYNYKGTTYTIGLTYYDWFGDKITYKIESQTTNASDTPGDTISLNGNTINIKNAGSAKIKVTANGDNNHYTYTAYISCNVAPGKRTFRFAESTKTIIYGSDYYLIAYEGNTNTTVKSGITYTSSKEAIAAVKNGVVTPKAYGQTTITGEWAGGRNYNTYYNNVIINVERKDATLSINDVTVTYNPNKTTYQLSLSKDTNGKITYSSSNESIATVNTTSGLVTINSAGSNTTITVSSIETDQYKPASDTCTVTVRKASTRLIVSTTEGASSSDTTYEYIVSPTNNKYVLYVSVLDTSNGDIPLDINADDIILDRGNQYFDITRSEKTSSNALKYTFTVNPNITNVTDTILRFAFSDNNRYSPYYENPTNQAVNVKITKQTANLTVTSISPTAIYKNEISKITVSNVNGRYLSASANYNMVSTSCSDNIVSVKADSSPNADTDVRVTITADANAYYGDSSVTATVKVKKTPTTPAPDITDPPTDPPASSQREREITFGGQTLKNGNTAEITGGSNTQFTLANSNFTTGETMRVSASGSTINNGSSSISFAPTSYESGYSITIDNKVTTTLSITTNNFNASVTINYGTNNQGGSGDYTNTEWEWALSAYACVVISEDGNKYGLCTSTVGGQVVWDSGFGSRIDMGNELYVAIDSVSIDTSDINDVGTATITAYQGNPTMGSTVLGQVYKDAYHYAKIFGTSTSSPEATPIPTTT